MGKVLVFFCVVWGVYVYDTSRLHGYKEYRMALRPHAKYSVMTVMIPLYRIISPLSMGLSNVLKTHATAKQRRAKVKKA